MTSSLKTYRVTVIEWLSHKGMLSASSPEQAERMARDLWAKNAEYLVFEFDDGGIDGITVEEVPP